MLNLFVRKLNERNLEVARESEHLSRTNATEINLHKSKLIRPRCDFNRRATHNNRVINKKSHMSNHQLSLASELPKYVRIIAPKYTVCGSVQMLVLVTVSDSVCKVEICHRTTSVY